MADKDRGGQIGRVKKGKIYKTEVTIWRDQRHMQIRWYLPNLFGNRTLAGQLFNGGHLGRGSTRPQVDYGVRTEVGGAGCSLP